MSLQVFDRAAVWLERGAPVALATVVKTGGSSPRPLGSKMAISSSGEFVGSVSGGCIEGAVIEEAMGVLRGGPPKRVEYGIADEQAWAVGLSCGGEIKVFIERLPSDDDQQHRSNWFNAIHQALQEERDVTSFTITATGTGQEHLLASRGLLLAESEQSGPSSTFYPSTEQRLEQARIDTFFELEPGAQRLGDLEIFVDHSKPPSKLVIVGAVHIAEHLVHFAQRLGFHCIVVDAREAFATKERFSHADQLLVGWPSEVLRAIPVRASTYCVFLTHDPKLDDEGIQHALTMGARYVGALGSRRTHDQRCARLTEAGVMPGQLARIDAPIGLDLGGRKPEEIAIAIAAGLVKVRSNVAISEAVRSK